MTMISSTGIDAVIAVLIPLFLGVSTSGLESYHLGILSWMLCDCEILTYRYIPQRTSDETYKSMETAPIHNATAIEAIG